MLFPHMKYKNMAGIFSFLLTVFIMAGCSTRKMETVQPVEKTQENSQSAEQSQADLETRLIHAAKVTVENQKTLLHILGNKELVYTSIKQSFPFRIELYLPDTRIAKGFYKNFQENESISDLTVTYADPEKTAAKIAIFLKEDLNYEVKEQKDALKVVIFSNVVARGQSKPSKIIMPEAGNNTIQQTIVPDKTAVMRHIEFNVIEDGESDILIQTNHPVKFDMAKGEGDLLYLNLYNTVIPEHHKRPLLTQYFKSAVERLTPVQLPGKEKNSRIQIKIRETVPYRIVQNQNIISVFFEPARIEPPVFAKGEKKTTRSTQRDIQTYQEPDPDIPESTFEDQIYDTPKVYTGEKIKLDFYEIDIKNVFRILRSVSGLNFAIDKDVEGKVTLTLKNPVPWDQVLDLVLEMNSLGQKKKGNVIRIATLDTLNKEEQFLQKKIEVQKTSLKQKKSLEPLVTEYIPINYSDAEADIQPHISQILTPERGKISVDKRTNMIIITDVQNKIDQARDTIYRLDRVTPQIMIEAKVVEVTKEFSRELGAGLKFSETENTGSLTDYSLALNNPSSNPVTEASFSLFRLFGTSGQLNAQLSASESKGDVKVVSSPRILTLDNKSAKIKQGLEYSYLERDDTGGSSVQFKNIDLLLEVTPHVTPDKRISMKIYITKNDIESITDGVPSLATNEAQTELLVNNNDTIVIGGIVKTTDNQTSSGTPYLSGIPILGWLFRTDIEEDKRNELLIFITPSIVQLEQKRN